MRQYYKMHSVPQYCWSDPGHRLFLVAQCCLTVVKNNNNNTHSRSRLCVSHRPIREQWISGEIPHSEAGGHACYFCDQPQCFWGLTDVFYLVQTGLSGFTRALSTRTAAVSLTPPEQLTFDTWLSRPPGIFTQPVFSVDFVPNET